jgi:WD40 repeat protein
LKGHNQLVDQMSVSRNGVLACTGDSTGTVKTWSATQGREVIDVGLWPWAVAYSPDGKYFSVAPYTGSLRLHDARSGALVRMIDATASGMSVLVAYFSPDGKRIAVSGSERSGRVFDVESGRQVLVLPRLKARTIVADFSPDGRYIASASVSGERVMADAATGVELWRSDAATNGLPMILFSADGRLVAWHCLAGARPDGSKQWEIPVLETRSGRTMYRVRLPANIASGGFSPDGRWLITGSEDGRIRYHSARDGRFSREIVAKGLTYLFAFSGDAERMATYGDAKGTLGHDVPNALEIRDGQTGRALVPLHGHTDSLVSLWFSKDMRTVLSSAFDMTVRQSESFPWLGEAYKGDGSFATRLRADARAYWRERLQVEAAGRSLAPSPEDSRQKIDRAFWPQRRAGAPAALIDLTPYYTSTLDTMLTPTAGAFDPDCDLVELPQGIVKLGGVEFDVRGAVLLRRVDPKAGAFDRMWDRYPMQVSGIPIHRKITRLHALQACAFRPTPPAGRIGSYVWRYADGVACELPIRYGEDLSDWWCEAGDSEKAPGLAAAAWVGQNAATRAKPGASIRLFLRSYENPRPGVEVASVDFVSGGTAAAPMLVALTVECGDTDTTTSPDALKQGITP